MKPQIHFVFLGGDLEFLGAKKNQKIDNIVLGACNELLVSYNVWIRKRDDGYFELWASNIIYGDWKDWNLIVVIEGFRVKRVYITQKAITCMPFLYEFL